RGTFLVDNGTTTRVTGTITNNGSFTLNSSGNYTDLFLNGDVTWTGSGTLNLKNAARILGSGILTNKSTIQGETSNALPYGFGTDQIGIVNDTTGLIDANVSGLVLNVDPNAANGLVNNGVMRASNGGILLLTGNGGGGFTNNTTITALDGSESHAANT